MRSLLAVVSLFSLVACGPPTMTPDSGTTSACSGPAKTPPNLLENPGFECDSMPAEWAGTIYGTFEFTDGGRSGRAGKLTATQAGGRFGYFKNIAADAVGKTFCYSAWIQGNAPFMRIKLISEANGSAFEDSFSSPITSTFARLPQQFTQPIRQGTTKLTMQFELQTNRGDGMNAMPGQYLLVDDADVWVSTTNCAEQR
jgi:hypothetical protein